MLCIHYLFLTYLPLTDVRFVPFVLRLLNVSFNAKCNEKSPKQMCSLPLLKIINLLSQVQENCSADEARLIDKVMEFLKREGLYSPQMKEIRTDDPIATDLIGALLTVRPFIEISENMHIARQ